MRCFVLSSDLLYLQSSHFIVKDGLWQGWHYKWHNTGNNWMFGEEVRVLIDSQAALLLLWLWMPMGKGFLLSAFLPWCQSVENERLSLLAISLHLQLRETWTMKEVVFTLWLVMKKQTIFLPFLSLSFLFFFLLHRALKGKYTAMVIMSEQ